MKLNDVRHIHLIGIAGTGMGALAGLLKKAGFHVTGSDGQAIYPPMSDKLKEWKIPVFVPYSTTNLEPRPDLVIVGNVATKDNVEAACAREKGLNYTSFPNALKELFLKQRESVVVAGTHGKTTSCALIAHTLVHAGQDPSFLIGGIPQNYGESFRLGQGRFFVVEGDEYDTAYFDKGPKFLHYCPKFLLATSLEYDHADIYENVEQIEARFRELFALVPPEGHLVVWAGAKRLTKLAKQAIFYGDGGDVTAAKITENQNGLQFDVIWKNQNLGAISSTLSGKHGIDNMLGCYALLAQMGLSHEQIAEGFRSFKGVKRRMEEVGQVNGIVVIDDFAHHPTAVATTIAAARKRYPNRPLWALFEPRSASSCRKVFQNDYAQSFEAADRVLLAPTGRALDPEIALDVPMLANDISQKGIAAHSYNSIHDIVNAVKHEVPCNAVLLCMSNGAFGGIHQQLLAALKAN